jgi:hypothetical protein
MEERKVIPFKYAGEDYAIKVLYEERLINVAAFRKNYPANGFRHQVQVPKYVSVQDVLDHEVIGELVEMCREDIRKRRWERLMGEKSK